MHESYTKCTLKSPRTWRHGWLSWEDPSWTGHGVPAASTYHLGCWPPTHRSHNELCCQSLSTPGFHAYHPEQPELYPEEQQWFWLEQLWRAVGQQQQHPEHIIENWAVNKTNALVTGWQVWDWSSSSLLRVIGQLSLLLRTNIRGPKYASRGQRPDDIKHMQSSSVKKT